MPKGTVISLANKKCLFVCTIRKRGQGLWIYLSNSNNVLHLIWINSNYLFMIRKSVYCPLQIDKDNYKLIWANSILCFQLPCILLSYPLKRAIKGSFPSSNLTLVGWQSFSKNPLNKIQQWIRTFFFWCLYVLSLTLVEHCFLCAEVKILSHTMTWGEHLSISNSICRVMLYLFTSHFKHLLQGSPELVALHILLI